MQVSEPSLESLWPCCVLLPRPLQVDAAGSRIAHHLRKHGVVPGDIVGVLLLRSPLMAPTLLGVWKAGAAYLPLDHHHPESRIAFMLQDARVKVGTTGQGGGGERGRTHSVDRTMLAAVMSTPVCATVCHSTVC